MKNFYTDTKFPKVGKQAIKEIVKLVSDGKRAYVLYHKGVADKGAVTGCFKCFEQAQKNATSKNARFVEVFANLDWQAR